MKKVFSAIILIICFLNLSCQKSQIKTKKYKPYFDPNSLLVREIQISDMASELKQRPDCRIRFREINTKEKSIEEIILPCSKENKKCKNISYRKNTLNNSNLQKIYLTTSNLFDLLNNYDKAILDEWGTAELIIKTPDNQVKTHFCYTSEDDPYWGHNEMIKGHGEILVYHIVMDSIFNFLSSDQPKSNYDKKYILNLTEFVDKYIRYHLIISYYILWQDLSVFKKTGYLEEKKDLLEFILKDDIPKDEKNALLIGQLEKLSSANDVVNSIDMLQIMSETMPETVCDEKVTAVIDNISAALEKKPGYLDKTIIEEYEKKLKTIISNKSCQ